MPTVASWHASCSSEINSSFLGLHLAGVVSCLLFVVSVDVEAEAAVRASLPLSSTTSPRGPTSGQPASQGGRAPDLLKPVWQALSLHRPVLVCINKASRKAKELAVSGLAKERCRAMLCQP
jgi:hypothetical protein